MKSSKRREEQRRAEATIAVVDAALADGSPSEEREHERELGRLALTLRSGAPEPSASFAADLEGRVWDGFTSENAGDSGSADRGVVGTARPSRSWRPSLNPAAAGAIATVALALVFAAGVLTRGDGIVGEGGTSGESRPVVPSAPERAVEPPNSRDGQSRAFSGDSGAPATGQSLPVLPSPGEPQSLRSSPSPGGATGFAPNQAQRRVERSASLTLAAPESRIDAVSQNIVAATERHRGYLVSSSTVSGEDAPAGGSFDLRVPVGELRATLSDLAALGTVRAQSQTGQDLTEPVATAEDRLDGARAERRGLLRRLERAGSDGRARALRSQVELVSAEIRGLRTQLKALEERTDYARVALTLTDESSSGAAGAPSSTESAVDDALASLVGAFNLLVRALGVLVPVAVVGLVAWLALRAFRRRRRESVLG